MLMKILFVTYMLFSYCDNLEISACTFTKLHIFSKTIERSELEHGGSIKISYPGTCIYKLERINNNEYKLVDHTKYLLEDIPDPVFSIDYEYKKFGLIVDAWIVIFTCFLISEWTKTKMLERDIPEKVTSNVISHLHSDTSREDKDSLEFMEIVDRNIDLSNPSSDPLKQESLVDEHPISKSEEEVSGDEKLENKENVRMIKDKLKNIILNEETNDPSARLMLLNEYIKSASQEGSLFDQNSEPSQGETNYDSEPSEDVSDDLKNVSVLKDIDRMNLQNVTSSNHTIIEELKPFEPSEETHIHKNNLNKKNKIDFKENAVEIISYPTAYVDKLKINKYPGYLYIDINSITRYMSSDQNVKYVSVLLESDYLNYETPDCEESSTIKLNTMVHLNIKNLEKDIKIRFVLQKKKERNSSSNSVFHSVEKSCEAELIINKEFIDTIHNNIVEVNGTWNPYSSNNIIKNIFSFFSSTVTDAWSLKTYVSYISEEELRLVSAPIPSDLYELSRWIKIKKYSYSTWYTGYVNLRGNIPDVCTYLWKRRFIKWHGYNIFIYNEQSKVLIGTLNLINLLNKRKKDIKITDEDSKVKIMIEQSILEFHFDNLDKFNTFKNVVTALI